MVNIGKWNELEVVKNVDFGAYLSGGNGVEILLPSRYIEKPLHPGEKINVFIYTDSEDRLIATTEHPFAEVGQFAFLEAVAVNKVGAFLDWGLPKDLLVPFSEQKIKMRPQMEYLVYVYLDDASKRVAASAKIEKFVGNLFPDFKHGDSVEALVISHDDRGYRCIVNNAHWGMVYANEIYRPLVIGDTVTAFVKQVRDDGKIDLTLSDRARKRTQDLSERLIEHMEANGGLLGLNDKSSPDEIKQVFQCSKKDFKKAVGHLLKEHKIVINNDEVTLSARE